MFACIVRLVVLFAFSGYLFAAIESYDFQNEEQRIRYQQLTEELRCPKCQNQNLADSDSQIAADLRRELHQQLLAGQSDEAIVDFMRDRYGDFVLYKPRLQRNTMLLWGAPVLLVLLVSALLWRSRSTTVVEYAVVVQSESQVVSADKPLLSSRIIHLVSLVLLIAVAVGSLALYRQLGSLQAMQITALAQKIYSGYLPQEQQIQQQEFLLSELDDWLAAHPDDERFIYMRARLFSEAGMWDKSAADYSRLVTKFPEQDNFLSEYAQVLFLQNNRSLTPDALAFLRQAIEVNPHNITALGLLGMSAFEQKDYRTALDFWQRLLRVIPPGTPQSQTIAEGVARARELSGQTDAPVALADIRLMVHVSLPETLHAQPDETVFVLLRAVNGPRMPLSAVKTTVAALSQPVMLDTASSPMRGQIDLAAIEQFEVVARLSRSGQPIPVEGDWEGSSEAFGRAAVPVELSVTIVKEIVN